MISTLQDQNQHLAGTVHQIQEDAKAQRAENEALRGSAENIRSHFLFGIALSVLVCL